MNLDSPVRSELPLAQGGTVSTETELCEADAHATLLRYRFDGPAEGRRRVDGKFRVELGLTPWHRSARARFPDYWSADRFERVGALSLIPPGFEACFRTDDDRPLRSVALEFDADRVYRLLPRLPELADWHLLTGLDLNAPRIRALLLRLAEEVRMPGFASAIIVEAITTQVAVELVRLGEARDEAPLRGGLTPWQLRQIDARLEAMGKAPTLAELAAICRISVRHLARGFRAARGTPVGAYVAHNRVEHAKRLLARDFGVTQVAAALGFSSASNFGVAFRRETGLAPTEYRRAMLGDVPAPGVSRVEGRSGTA